MTDIDTDTDTDDHTLPPGADEAAPMTGDARLWFAWAISLFWFFRAPETPRPTQFESVSKWAPKFDKWASENVSSTCQAIAAFILRFWNSSIKWKTGKAMGDDFHRAFANMDNGNRRGIVALLRFARFF